MNEIEINGKKYPMRMTMGAILRFKNMTGHEPDQKHLTGNIEETVIFVYCVIKSACNAEKVAFDIPKEDFADMLSPDEFTQISAKLTVDPAPSPKKKEKTINQKNVGKA